MSERAYTPLVAVRLPRFPSVYEVPLPESVAPVSCTIDPSRVSTKSPTSRPVTAMSKPIPREETGCHGVMGANEAVAAGALFAQVTAASRCSRFPALSNTPDPAALRVSM